MTININTPGGLIASLPPLMGFVPQEGVVAVVFNSMGNIISILRLELESPEDAYLHVNGILRDLETAHFMAVLVIGPQPGTPEFPLSNIHLMYPEKMLAPTEGEYIFAIPRFIQGAPVVEVRTDGSLYLHGELPDWKSTEVAAENVLRGGNTVEANEMGIIANFLQEIPPKPDTYTGTDVKAWVRSIYDEELRPSNRTIWTWLEDSVENRDWIIGQLPVDPGRAFSEFAAVARASGGKGREEALTIAGVAAYLRGKGAHAQVAFQLAQHEAVERGDDAVLAAIAGTMVLNGLPPSEIADVCQKIAQNHV